MVNRPPGRRGPYPPGHPANQIIGVPGIAGRELVGAAAVHVENPPPASKPPAILVNTVVVSLGKLPDGDLIELVEAPWRALIALLTKDPNARFQIPPRDLEEIVAASYRDAGFDEVILTPRSGDRGRDVIATKHGHFSLRILDQVKALRVGHLVTANDVRALVGVISADQQASKGLVTTTSDFAPGVANEFKSMIPTRLELVNGPRFLERLAEYSKKEK
jgi:restriction system protein